jgi:hypothetical protein
LIVQIYGRHYHNAEGAKLDGAQYVIETLISKLASQKMHDLGVSYPVLVKPGRIEREEILIPSPKRRPNDANKPEGPTIGGMGGAAGDASAAAENKVGVNSFTFRVQFVWQPKLATDQMAQATTAAGAGPATSPVGPAPGVPPATATAPGTGPVPAASPVAGVQRAPAAVPPPAAGTGPAVPPAAGVITPKR